MATVVANVPAIPPLNDGFRQAMLKTALEMILLLTEENYSIWKDKMTALLKLRGVLARLNNVAIPLGESDNAELTLLIISKMDSITHQNVTDLPLLKPQTERGSLMISSTSSSQKMLLRNL
ncbi:hypothetical protein VP01_4025g1 [Puccinia sorghi]|uniref:DUF4219 domain-containing protein n=1 Tax=Puccinia sorghi TaxID=27349 RepID=A0A0L6UTP4_9BASI|nr:hypothetical protein VP01_4025g1 [Puccinia sorghi]